MHKNFVLAEILTVPVMNFIQLIQMNRHWNKYPAKLHDPFLHFLIQCRACLIE